MKKRIGFVGLFLLASFALFVDQVAFENKANVPELVKDRVLDKAFESRKTNFQVTGTGTVQRILKDDLEGSQHQRFLLALESGLTLLVAHNIDMAPRINALKIGDRVNFYGEYEWNEKGGVIHWTHHDPAGRHVGGWLIHNGKKYQ